MKAVAVTWFVLLCLAMFSTLGKLATKTYPRTEQVPVLQDALALALHAALLVWIGVTVWGAE